MRITADLKAKLGLTSVVVGMMIGTNMVLKMYEWYECAIPYVAGAYIGVKFLFSAIDQARREGRQEGRKEGMAEGEAHVLDSIVNDPRVLESDLAPYLKPEDAQIYIDALEGASESLKPKHVQIHFEDEISEGELVR